MYAQPAALCVSTQAISEAVPQAVAAATAASTMHVAWCSKEVYSLTACASSSHSKLAMHRAATSMQGRMRCKPRNCKRTSTNNVDTRACKRASSNPSKLSSEKGRFESPEHVPKQDPLASAGRLCRAAVHNPTPRSGARVACTAASSRHLHTARRVARCGQRKAYLAMGPAGLRSRFGGVSVLAVTSARNMMLSSFACMGSDLRTCTAACLSFVFGGRERRGRRCKHGAQA